MFRFYIAWQECSQTVPVRIFWDTGGQILCISSKIVSLFHVPKVKRDVLMQISGTNDINLADEGQAFTHPLLLSHDFHESQKPFEIIDLHSDVDMILPDRWITKHGVS